MTVDRRSAAGRRRSSSPRGRTEAAGSLGCSGATAVRRGVVEVRIESLDTGAGSRSGDTCAAVGIDGDSSGVVPVIDPAATAVDIGLAHPAVIDDRPEGESRRLSTDEWVEVRVMIDAVRVRCRSRTTVRLGIESGRSDSPTTIGRPDASTAIWWRPSCSAGHSPGSESIAWASLRRSRDALAVGVVLADEVEEVGQHEQVSGAVGRDRLRERNLPAGQRFEAGRELRHFAVAS